MTENEVQKKEDLLKEIETSIQRYRTLRKRFSAIQWIILFLVTVAGFLTTAAGSVDAKNSAWFASSYALTIWGLVAAIGSMVVQNLNPAQKVERFEKKKDAMRSIRTALKYRNLDIEVAAVLVELARRDPAQALDDLSNQKSG